MSLGSPTPVRRSALEAIHAALGARWIADTVRWPASYGAPEAEAATIERAAGLAEIGPLNKIVVRGPAARAAAQKLVPTDELWALTEDEVLVVTTGQVAPELGRFTGRGLVVVDVSSAFAALRLGGPASVRVLEEACPVDLRSSTLVQAPVANVRAIVRRDDDRPMFTILVARDEAEYLWDALFRLGRPHGLEPVGPGAVAPRVSMETGP